jgi:acyl-CoA synthetase (AMP-forming)/AMP-acid ligase II
MSMQLTQFLRKARREHPERVAAVCGDRRTSFAELARRVEGLAGALVAAGAQAGDRIALFGLNSDRYLETLLACWWAGLVAAPVNCRWAVEEIVASFQDCEPRILFIDDPFLPMLPALRERTPSLATIVYMGDAALPEGALRYEAILAAAEPLPDSQHGGEDPAVLFYTGGTTGRAKGVLLSHGGLYVTALASSAGRTPGATNLNGVPMFHVAGLIVLLHAMVGHSTQVMLAAFDPGKFLELVERERVAETGLVPTMIKRLVDHPAIGERDLSSWNRLYYGGSPIDEALLEQTVAKLPLVSLMQFYGMTETSAISAALPNWCHQAEGRAEGCHRAAGFPVPSMEMRIAGPHGEELPADQVGEVWLRGPGVMLRYWNRPEETAQAVQDGWMRTGDAGYLDSRGLLYIADRLKDMIVTGGENVYSAEVENAVLSLPGIAQCAVIGVPDAEWGERVHAVLVLQPGAEIDAKKVIDHCRSLIAGYKCPRSVEFRSEIPISGAGKLMKFKLREPYWQTQMRGVA